MNDPIALLKKDHREAEAMLKTLADSKPGARRQATVKKLTTALQLHMRIEEDEVYPFVAKRVGEEDAEEANIEHALAAMASRSCMSSSANRASAPPLRCSPPGSSIT